MTGRILVTGASGFVGRALVADLAAANLSVRAAMRHPADIFARSVEVVAVSDLTRPVEWRALLKGIDTVVHLAGIAHAGPGIAEEIYDRVNRLATAELAAAAKAAGIRSLVLPRRSAHKADHSPAMHSTNPNRRARPTPMAAPSLPQKRRCAPPAYRSPFCVRSWSMARA